MFNVFNNSVSSPSEHSILKFKRYESYLWHHQNPCLWGSPINVFRDPFLTGFENCQFVCIFRVRLLKYTCLIGLFHRTLSEGQEIVSGSKTFSGAHFNSLNSNIPFLSSYHSTWTYWDVQSLFVFCQLISHVIRPKTFLHFLLS